MDPTRPGTRARAETRRPGQRTVLVAVAAALIAAPILAGTLASSSSPVGADTPDQRYIEIDCGGYDAEGRVEEPRATRIERVPVADDGRVEIPAVCGGHTADGTFVGDD